MTEFTTVIGEGFDAVCGMRNLQITSLISKAHTNVLRITFLFESSYIKSKIHVNKELYSQRVEKSKWAT